MADDEAMKAMARRIALEAWPHDIPITKPLRLYMENASLAAIIETREWAAALAEQEAGWLSRGPDIGPKIAAAIRSGQQFRGNEK